VPAVALYTKGPKLQGTTRNPPTDGNHVAQAVDAGHCRLASLERRRGRDQHARAAVGEAVANGVGAKQAEQRQGNGAELLHGDVGGEALRTLRQMGGDHDAATDAGPGQGLWKTV